MTQLLLAMGRLDVSLLLPGEDVYDPSDNYERVRNRGGLPWDGVIEAIDRFAAPGIRPANDAEDAPIDTRLKGDTIQTSPRN